MLLSTSIAALLSRMSSRSWSWASRSKPILRLVVCKDWSNPSPLWKKKYIRFKNAGWISDSIFLNYGPLQMCCLSNLTADIRMYSSLAHNNTFCSYLDYFLCFWHVVSWMSLEYFHNRTIQSLMPHQICAGDWTFRITPCSLGGIVPTLGSVQGMSVFSRCCLQMLLQ